jgi:hypothetical protein
MAIDDTPLEAPVAPGPLQDSPGTKVGILVGLLIGVYTLAGGGGLDDGWQWADLATDRLTFSQNQADYMAPRGVQREAVKERS